MSTAAIDTTTESTSRRQGTSRPRAVSDRTRRDLITGTTDALRTILPGAALRPTDAVELTFDVAEQLLASARRVCTEVATIVESGIQGLERRAA